MSFAHYCEEPSQSFHGSNIYFSLMYRWTVYSQSPRTPWAPCGSLLGWHVLLYQFMWRKAMCVRRCVLVPLARHVHHPGFDVHHGEERRKVIKTERWCGKGKVEKSIISNRYAPGLEMLLNPSTMFHRKNSVIQLELNIQQAGNYLSFYSTRENFHWLFMSPSQSQLTLIKSVF